MGTPARFVDEEDDEDNQTPVKLEIEPEISEEVIKINKRRNNANEGDMVEVAQNNLNGRGYSGDGIVVEDDAINKGKGQINGRKDYLDAEKEIVSGATDSDTNLFEKPCNT